MTECYTIKNESGKTLKMMMEPKHVRTFGKDVEFVLSRPQLYRIIAESDTGAWHTDTGKRVRISCAGITELQLIPRSITRPIIEKR